MVPCTPCTRNTFLNATQTVDGQKVPDVHRRLICQKVSVSRNLSQKVIPSDEDFSCLYPSFTTYYNSDAQRTVNNNVISDI